jgi:bifunctional UDP-N-acetylglucosamine pyrophosphorylase/glucosamine-1-phosphate N-acetyltransferase
MKSALPKVMHRIAGRPMLGHVLAVARALGAKRMVVVTAPDAEQVAALAKEWGAETVVQDRQLGTGHAVLAARAALGEFAGNVLVLFGDAPLLTAATLGKLVSRLQTGADIAALGFIADNPAGYAGTE